MISKLVYGNFILSGVNKINQFVSKFYEQTVICFVLT